MLHIVPLHWYKWDFKIFEDDRPIAVIDRSWRNESGQLILEDATYEIYRKGAFFGTFVLEKEGAVVAEAEKPSAFKRQFEIKYATRRFVLKSISVFGRGYDLIEDGRIIGSIVARSVFTRKARADLPEEMPLSVRVFVIFLVLLLWKREATAAAGS